MRLLPENMRLLTSGKPLIPHSRWRRGAFLFAMAAFLTFAFNFSFTVWATSTRTLEHDIGIISEAKCPTIKKWNTAIHMIINIISTVLLSGSNYCMQCLIAPTRLEVDEAHSKLKSFDIGVPSIRNFWKITHKRKMLWLLLSMSSFPLHLLFNSVVFGSISINLYQVYTVDSHFLEEDGINSWQIPSPEPLYGEQLVEVHAAYQAGEFERLSLEECINTYGTTFQASRGTLLLIVSDDVPKDTVNRTTEYFLHYGSWDVHEAFRWMCHGNSGDPSKRPCGDLLPGIKAAPEDWKPGEFPLKECYSQPTEERCKLLFSNSLCWVVTILNLLKGILMLFVAFGGNEENPLLTVGDAVASYLEEEDMSTENMCLSSKTRMKKQNWDKIALPYEGKPRRKFAAASGMRWVTCILLCLLALSACVALLVYGLNPQRGIDPDLGITRFGLGEIHPETVMQNQPLFGDEMADMLLINVILANTPQVIMSLLYFNFNALFTSISLVTEWDRFGRAEEKGLRVSSRPQGAQRQTYFLQLPYRYSLPLTFFSGGVHWLISQSVFLVYLEINWPMRDNPTKYVPNSDRLASCGWSPLGVIFVVVAGVLMIGFLLFSGWRRLRFGGIPVAGLCSAAISAACHPGTYEKDAWKMPLRWGVVSEPKVEPRHCSFSSKPVEKPVEGQLYA